MCAYLDDNRELIDQSNKEEQKRQRFRKACSRRKKRLSRTSKKLRDLLDSLDDAIERREPADCVSRKWVG